MTTTKQARSLPLPPGSFGLPIIGETISFLRDPNFVQRRYQQYGQIFKTHVLGRPTIFLIGAEATRFLFANEKHYFSDGIANGVPPQTKALMGNGSVVMQMGDEHLKQRKLLSQAFQPRALAGYASTMEEISRSYLHKWELLGHFSWYSELRKYTLDVACKLLIGTEAASDRDFGKWYEIWGKGLLSIPVPLPWTKFGRALRCRKLILARIEEIVKERQQQATSTQLEQVLKEVLRVFPPSTGPREVIESCEFNGHLIPKGWKVLYHSGTTHQDSRIYTQPECFDPERFAPERAEDKQKPMSYIPFGGGLRECLGREFAKLEIKLFAALLVREYEWELLPGQNLDMVMLPTVYPREGLKVKFWRRVQHG